MTRIAMIDFANYLDKHGLLDYSDQVDRIASKMDELGVKSVYDDPENFERKHKKTIDKGLYYLKTDAVRVANDENTPLVDVVSSYTKDGHYIGDPDTAKYLIEDRGISPQLAHDSNKVCSIGYQPKEKSYYGWSHRAISSFGIGDNYFDGFTEDEDKNRKIKTMDEAKESAINFADSVA
jgi:hypothetical protein